MDFYHSFWEFGYNKMDENLHNLHELSLRCCLKNHGNIHLITTPKGKEFLGDLPYTSIEIFENEIDPKYSRFWALSKIYAFGQIAKKQKPFIHLDYDVFLFKPLPEKILNSRVCAQEIEVEKIQKVYEIEKFNKVCNNKYLMENNKSDCAYNTGIFGGDDLEFIKFYVEEVLKLVEDPENFDLFDKEYFNRGVRLSTILEQYYLAICVSHLNIDVGVLFKHPNEYDKALEIGYTHLMGAKNSQKVLKAVKDKIVEYT
jgi:hypothetical protein